MAGASHSQRRRGVAAAWPSIVVLAALALLAWAFFLRRGVMPATSEPVVAPTTPRTSPPTPTR
jgi:hypothetical protein